MKLKAKTKGIIRKIALVLAGVCALGAVGFGVAKLVEFVKDDLKTITPSFDVGNLGTDGKYVSDESTLYTKEAFECDGLQIKLDFDNEINYQIYFYDDLDNFVESTEVLSAAYSETVHDGYARIVIIPTNDEDEKISLTERVTYPGQMTIKVAKEQNVEYYQVFNKRFYVVNNISDMRFIYGGFVRNGDGLIFDTDIVAKYHCTTSRDLLRVNGGEVVSFKYDKYENSVLMVTEFKMTSNGLSLLNFNKALIDSGDVSTITLNKDTDFVIFYSNIQDSDGLIVKEDLEQDYLDNINQYITITK